MPRDASPHILYSYWILHIKSILIGTCGLDLRWGGVCPIVSSYKALFSVADFEDFHDADTLGALQAADDE